jgi:xanthine dehydrogenase YagS FAD-binding subunit
VGAAIALRTAGGRVAGARVVLSGVAPTPWRARRAEAALVGRRLDATTVAAAAAAAADAAEPLEQNAYKVPLVKGLVEERLQALAAG